jgi:site-specific DNA recombinase
MTETLIRSRRQRKRSQAIPALPRTHAVIYFRVSDDRQVENTSLSVQEKDCRPSCEKQRLTVLSVFVDGGESAKTADRKQFLKAIDLCVKDRTVRNFVVWKLDRFARNTLDHEVLNSKLNSAGVQLVSVTEPLASDSNGALYGTILAAVAQHDNKARSARTVAGMAARTGQERWVWRAPLGYLHSGDQSQPSLLPDPERASLIRLLFELVAAGAAKCGCPTGGHNSRSAHQEEQKPH